MNLHLNARLLAMATRDLEVWERLARDGSLFEGYHPQMQAVHEENARELQQVIATHGWPTPELVGEDGAEAAWLIAQHAIGLPAFQRLCLKLIHGAVAGGELPGWQWAMLLDRIRTFEGHPQVFGTQFDWNERGEMAPLPIEDADRVDQRRAEIGLEPLAAAKARHEGMSEVAPPDLAERARRAEEWAHKVGWR